MKASALKREIDVLVALLVAFMCAGCSAATPAPSARDQMLGAWDLRSRTVRADSGEVVADPILGAKPVGRLYYDASGRMGLQMMRQGREQAITIPDVADQARNARIVLGYDSYFGTFAVDEPAGTVTHHVEGSLFPEDLGKDFTRRFRVDGDTFELSFTSPPVDGRAITRTLIFQRAR
jgi:hypothetical protein